MANSAVAILETALRARKLDRTLTTALPPLDRSDPATEPPLDIPGLDAVLHGGLPRGQLSEIAGPQSSGRTTLLLHLIGAVTRRGELAALVDTCDRLDVPSAAAAGVDLDRFLWIRGETGPIDRIVDRAIKALTLVLQAGGFGVVTIDLTDVPPRVLKSLPFTTWLRIQRIVEGSDTACLLLGSQPVARSAGGLTMMCQGRAQWAGATAPTRRVCGLETGVRIVSPRRRVDGEATLGAVSIDELTNRRMDASVNPASARRRSNPVDS